MAFTREDIATYEKGPQTVVADPIVETKKDATSAGDTADKDLTVDSSSEVVTDPDVQGDETSDETADSSTADADLSGDIETKAAPAKGSAAERIQELNDLMHGYKEFGKEKAEEVAALRAEIAAIKRGSGTQAAVRTETTPVETDEPLPDLQDADVNFDTDKLRAKTQKWIRQQIANGTRAALKEATGQTQVEKMRSTFETNAKNFAETHKDWNTVVTKNQTLIEHQLAPAAAVAVAKSELGPDIVYHFGQNLDLAVRIASLPVADQLEYIGELKAELKAKKAASKPADGKTTTVDGAKPAAKKSITQAPTPPTATRAAGRAQQRDETDTSLSMDDFAKQHRDKRQAARKTNRSQRGLD
jgi:hypothetical protein